MVDVGRDDGAAARDFAAHEFRRDERRHRGAEAFAVVMRGLRAVEHLLAAEVFALGDVDHLLGDDAGAGPFELRDRLAGRGARSGFGVLGKLRARCLPVTLPLSTGLIGRPSYSSTPPRSRTQAMRARGEALLDVDRRRRDRYRGRTDRRPAAAPRRRIHAARSRAAALAGRARVGRRIDLARAGERAGGDLGRDQIGCDDRLIHGASPLNSDSGGLGGLSEPGAHARVGVAVAGDVAETTTG